MSKPASPINYNRITEKNLTPWRIFLQWIVIQIFYLWYHSKFRIHVHGRRENVPKGFHSHVIVSNHTSNLDPPLLCVALNYQPTSFMAKEELFQKPALANFLHTMATFSVNREKLEPSTIKSALTILKSGKWSLGIFPEGTRSKDGQIGKAKRGAAFLAHAGKAPILPVGIYRTHDKKSIYVEIGERFMPTEDLDATTAQIEESIARLAETARQRAGE